MNKLQTRSEATVTQANELIRAAYTMSLNEKRLVLLAVSKVNPQDNPHRILEPGEPITVGVNEWASMMPQDKNPYQSLRRASEALLDNKWYPIRNDHNRKKGKYNWLSHCLWDQSTQSVEMVFTHATLLRLIGLSAEFTKYSLQQALLLGSPIRMRIFELISQYKATGYLTIKLATLREMLMLENKYQDWPEFQRRVVKPAVDEINARTDLNVRYTPFREARKVAGVEFFF